MLYMQVEMPGPLMLRAACLLPTRNFDSYKSQFVVLEDLATVTVQRNILVLQISEHETGGNTR